MSKIDLKDAAQAVLDAFETGEQFDPEMEELLFQYLSERIAGRVEGLGEEVLATHLREVRDAIDLTPEEDSDVDVWGLFQDPDVREEIAALSDAEKKIVDEMTRAFVEDVHTFAALSTQKNGGGHDYVAGRIVEGEIEEMFRLANEPEKELYYPYAKALGMESFFRNVRDDAGDYVKVLFSLAGFAGISWNITAGRDSNKRHIRHRYFTLIIENGRFSDLLRNMEWIDLLPLVLRNAGLVLNPDTLPYFDIPRIAKKRQRFTMADLPSRTIKKVVTNKSGREDLIVSKFSSKMDFCLRTIDAGISRRYGDMNEISCITGEGGANFKDLV